MCEMSALTVLAWGVAVMIGGPVILMLLAGVVLGAIGIYTVVTEKR